MTHNTEMSRPAKRSFDGSRSIDELAATGENMGNTWEVQVWKRIEWRGGEYGYEEFWRGQSWLGAAWNFIKAKREGHGCVTLHWR